MSGDSGPRRRLSAEQRREQLVAAAVEVLAERGYGSATADVISTRAGVSKGLLWHYFDDLDHLFETTARLTLDRLSRATAEAIDLTAPAPDVIRAAVHATVGLRRTHGAERRAMEEIVANLRAPNGRLRLDQHDLEGLYAAQEAIFRRGQQEGDFVATFDPRALAVTYQGAVEHLLGYLDAYPDADADRLAATIADVILGGIRRVSRD